MPTHSLKAGIWASIVLAGLAHAHLAPFHKGMFCINGSDPTQVDMNSNAPTLPAFNMTYSDFWFHHFNGCDKIPPEEGVFLELPAGGSVTMEMADNQAWTTLNPHAVLTDWGDGKTHPEDYSMTNLGGLQPSDSHCLPSPNLHAQNESMAAGTALAISYQSEISNVTPDNLVVFTVRYNTPWKRLITYDVPSGMPPCPPEGCLCTFLWIPNGCGISNMYMFPYKCKVLPDSTPTKTIGTPKPAVWCEDDPTKCVQGPKQMLIWHQLDSNNIEVEGYDLSGHPKSPAYNAKCGFGDGAQNDIFVDSGASTTATSATGSGTPTSSTPSTLPASSAPAYGQPSASGSSTPTQPASSAPAYDQPSASGSSAPAPSSSVPASDPPTASSTCSAGNGAHSKRMMMRRERSNIF